MKALVTGIYGQDSAYLAKLLVEKGYEVVGGARRNASGGPWRLERVGIKDKVHIVDFELTEFSNIFNVIRTEMPDEIYNLGAMSFVGSSFSDPLYVMDINAGGPKRILESIKIVNPKIKFYQASTSEMFGKVQETPQKETTPFYPRSPYGISKLTAHWHVVNDREAYNLFACSGILFNHESPLRGSEFVTKKIVEYCVRFKLGKTKEPLRLGNLEAKRDWGFAEDYVRAMYLMMQQQVPSDYVISTGETYSVKDFIVEVLNILELKEIPIVIDPKFYRPTEVDILTGDSTKAHRELGWVPKTSFSELARQMVNSELLCYSD